MKCVNCKRCISFNGEFYICQFIDGSYEAIEECIANDDNIDCDGYEQDRYDDFTES